MKTKNKEKEMEKCVLCHKELNIPRETPIQNREHYIEGCGQLCYECYRDTYSNAANATQIT